MKQLILTGLATEQSFSNGGQAQYFLVFNGGELRVPVTEEAAEVVVKEMFQVESETVQTQDFSGPEYTKPQSEDEWDDGVDQV